MYLSRILVWVCVGGCDCSNYIYKWVYLSRIYLCVGAVECLKTFMDGCDCLEDMGGRAFLEHIYGWV